MGRYLIVMNDGCTHPQTTERRSDLNDRQEEVEVMCANSRCGASVSYDVRDKS